MTMLMQSTLSYETAQVLTVYESAHLSWYTLFRPQKFWVTFVFHFSFGVTVVPRKIEDNAYAKFGGPNKVIMGDVQMANKTRKTEIQFCNIF